MASLGQANTVFLEQDFDKITRLLSDGEWEGGGGQNYFLKILDMHMYHTSSLCAISHHVSKFVNL